MDLQCRLKLTAHQTRLAESLDETKPGSPKNTAAVREISKIEAALMSGKGDK